MTHLKISTLIARCNTIFASTKTCRSVQVSLRRATRRPAPCLPHPSLWWQRNETLFVGGSVVRAAVPLVRGQIGRHCSHRRLARSSRARLDRHTQHFRVGPRTRTPFRPQGQLAIRIAGSELVAHPPSDCAHQVRVFSPTTRPITFHDDSMYISIVQPRVCGPLRRNNHCLSLLSDAVPPLHFAGFLSGTH